MPDFRGVYDIEFLDGEMRTLELDGAIWDHYGTPTLLLDKNGTRYNYRNIISFRPHEGAN